MRQISEKKGNHDKASGNADEQRKPTQPPIWLSHHKISAKDCLDSEALQVGEQQKEKKMKVAAQHNSKTKNTLRDFVDWALVIIAFGLVAISLYYMSF